MPKDERPPTQTSHMSSLIVSNDDGSTEGRHPDEIDPADLGHPKLPMAQVIRAKCLDCCCGQPAEVRKCASTGCALWPYRMGTNPFHGRRGRAAAAGAFGKKTPVVNGEINETKQC